MMLVMMMMMMMMVMMMMMMMMMMMLMKWRKKNVIHLPNWTTRGISQNIGPAQSKRTFPGSTSVLAVTIHTIQTIHTVISNIPCPTDLHTIPTPYSTTPSPHHRGGTTPPPHHRGKGTVLWLTHEHGRGEGGWKTGPYIWIHIYRCINIQIYIYKYLNIYIYIFIYILSIN